MSLRLLESSSSISAELDAAAALALATLLCVDPPQVSEPHASAGRPNGGGSDAPVGGMRGIHSSLALRAETRERAAVAQRAAHRAVGAGGIAILARAIQANPNRAPLAESCMQALLGLFEAISPDFGHTWAAVEAERTATVEQRAAGRAAPSAELVPTAQGGSDTLPTESGEGKRRTSSEVMVVRSRAARGAWKASLPLICAALLSSPAHGLFHCRSCLRLLAANATLGVCVVVHARVASPSNAASAARLLSALERTMPAVAAAASRLSFDRAAAHASCRLWALLPPSTPAPAETLPSLLACARACGGAGEANTDSSDEDDDEDDDDGGDGGATAPEADEADEARHGDDRSSSAWSALPCTWPVQAAHAWAWAGAGPGAGAGAGAGAWAWAAWPSSLVDAARHRLHFAHMRAHQPARTHAGSHACRPPRVQLGVTCVDRCAAVLTLSCRPTHESHMPRGSASERALPLDALAEVALHKGMSASFGPLALRYRPTRPSAYLPCPLPPNHLLTCCVPYHPAICLPAVSVTTRPSACLPCS